MSTKYPSPLLGYNNNVRHKGRVFHIQTEDSGAKYGHIITHLFMDGGRILKSVKTSYAEYIGNDRMSDIVREMMKQQHKAMFIALRDGKFDPTIEAGTEASQTTQALAAESANRVAASTAEASGGAARAPAATASATASAGPEASAKPPTPARASDRPRPMRFTEDEGPPTEATRELHPELMVDMQALERAAAAASNVSPVVRGTADLPPPPPNLFREKGSGKYKVATPSKRSSGPIPREEPTGDADAPRGSGRPADPSTPERRYAPTRPAAIFGQVAPQQGKSIFGEDLISDKSLDEVILSYLAEDLEEKK
ncbi:MAG TPA: hypothetical protein VKU41_25100 [Polyangiaceae bacterium]|nr:hypothetical protein [Polyangiaceae bacterium]